MMTFYDLKHALHFPRTAGTIRHKRDIPLLYDLVRNERHCSYENARIAASALVKAGLNEVSERLVQDAKMLNDSYVHDLTLLADFINQEGMSFI